MDRLFLEHLRLNHFKNFDNEHFSFVNGFNIITGKNGMGKTNVLDAIYYQSVFKSYFARKDSDLIQQGFDFFRIEGSWKLKDEALKIAQAYRDGQKMFFLNGQKDSNKSEFIGQLPVVLICPEDQLMIREGSRIRRKIFDHILSLTDQKYLRVLMQYNRLLRQRNQYL
ncbi:MAG TPA: AAA family ATPase, partial [Saprospiraceae bacterium]|nr:AAA family ATPase [Saprospiraceae bacterium]